VPKETDYLAWWAFARIELGLGQQEFWDLTFEELDALIERRQVLDKRAEYQNLLVVCSIYNAQRTSKTQKVLKPEDFMDLPSTRTSSKGIHDRSDPELEGKKSRALFASLDAFAARCGINNAGEQEARERIAREKAEAEAEANSQSTEKE
jgi:hypothetical protein